MRVDLSGADRSVYTPNTPGQREEIWPAAARQKSNSGPFDLSTGSPPKAQPVPADGGSRRPTHPLFGSGGVSNPSVTLRNLIISPMKRPQLSRGRPNMFT